jgi:Bardet-Biedl syndrome 9 protein
MSVFQLQDWWNVQICQSEEFDLGCMVVGNIDNADPPTSKIAVGSQQEGMLRIYNPTRPQYRVEDLILEESLGQPILQLLLGQFIPSDEHLGLAILFPKKLAVYEITPQGNKDGRGANYYTMRKCYDHILGVDGKHFTAYNMTVGAFGGVKGRDMFIIQSLDGKLQIFEQSANAFTRQLVDCLVPCPIAYLPRMDAFVTTNYACKAECYRYQVLAIWYWK